MLTSRSLVACSRAVAPRLAPAVPARGFISPLYNFAKKVMPKISDTERAALESGTIGFDRDLFSGKPSLKALDKYDATLSAEEQSFLDNETNQLLEMIDDYSVWKNGDLPPEVWRFMKEKKFLGMIIPKEFGGLGFSAHGHSQIITRIASHSVAASVSVMVPNSLGPAELLLKYGTPEQQKYYLPRLADGRDVPCFGLTGPPSGSDAASMVDEGFVCKNEKGEVGIRATFNKRYITLAPIASVVGLAIKLKDPNMLLTAGSEGITVALIPRSLPGLDIGSRHDPLGVPFMNGTVRGTDVFIPMSCVIGGEARCGYGWNMLMECLSEGRGVSLPASGLAMARQSCNAVGAYARIRKQFKVPIADMEGVQERLADMASETLRMAGAQALMNAMLNAHERPAVLSGVMKLHLTERGRKLINHSMDVLGGAGICRGPNNFAAHAYIATPVAITVEGSNILTRSLIVFGQGLTRSHPHLLDLIHAIRRGNDQAGFNKHLSALLGHAARNGAGSLKSCLSSYGSQKDLIAYYEAQLVRLSSNFAFCSDMCLSMGGKLKFAEMVSGRMADILCNLYVGFATLWWHKRNAVPGSDVLLEHAMRALLCEIQASFFGVFDNFPYLGAVMKLVCFPTGRVYSPPSDALTKKVSNLITTETPVRALLSQNVFVSQNPDNRIRMLNTALPTCIQADDILARCRKERREPTSAEQAVVAEADRLRAQIIQVDAFPPPPAQRAEGVARPAEHAAAAAPPAAGATKRATAH